MKIISVGIFYRPQMQTNFLEILFQDLKNSIKINKNEVCIVGDFNINLLYDGSYILKENKSCKYKNLITPLLNQ